jgi:hypothetical protein
MIRTAESAARDAKIAELKRLITSGQYETLEKLEEAVDAFLWGDEDDAPCMAFEAGRSKPR